MKKVISLLLVGSVLICALCGCGENAKDSKSTEIQTESQTESADRQTSSVQSEAKNQTQVQVEPVTPEPERPKPVYYHAAIKGAVIVEQDGSSGYYYTDIPANDTSAECIIAKNRYGEIGTVKLNWNSEKCCFE